MDVINKIKNRFKSLPIESRRNIVVMVIICFMFIIGIVFRWGYIKTEVTDSVNRYIEAVNPSNNKDSI